MSHQEGVKAREVINDTSSSEEGGDSPADEGDDLSSEDESSSQVSPSPAPTPKKGRGQFDGACVEETTTRYACAK